MSGNWATTHREIVSGQRRGLGATLARRMLAAASVPYALAMRLRNLLFDLGWKRVHRAAVPVISVGNLTLGGTGKTPAVEWLARYYRARGQRVAVLSRGYGQSVGRNDEALVLEENLPDVPHLQGKDRVALAQTAVAELDSEILLLDDGFQHRRLHRDLDLVLIDATDPWGQAWVFPRGRLREPQSRLRQASVVALTRCDQVSAPELQQLRAEVTRLAPKSLLVESIHSPDCLRDTNGTEEALTALRERPVAAFCGLGNPDAFFRTVVSLGADLRMRRTYEDHYPYRREDVEELNNWADGLPPDAWVVTSQKDLVKLRLTHLRERPLWAVRIAWRLTAGEAELQARLEQFLPSPKVAPSPVTDDTGE